MLKRLSLILVLAFAITMLFSGVAYANFGPHGGYVDDTDACAGCHRAHTSFSTITWTDQFNNSHSALLVSDATTIEEFCNACHGDDAPGAATNVVSGVFDSGPSGEDGLVPGNMSGTNGVTDGGVDVQVEFETNSTFDAGLNGGGFVRMPDPYVELTTTTPTYKVSTSMHDMEDGAATDPMWGAGSSAPAGTNLTCTDCHDPHGSSNYRLLKGLVNGNTVGGYDASDVPNPFVISAEEGYPTTGWLKHEPGQAQMAAYQPNYTDPEYAWQGPDVSGFRSMSAWCAACHEEYDDKTSAYDYGTYESFGAFSVGSQTRHRHPVQVTLAAGVGPGRALEEEVIIDADFLPLEARPGSPNARGVWDTQDYLGCLTCHRAHGTSVDMTGWAEASLQTTDGTGWYPVRSTQPTVSGVNPNFTSALLRADNRGVCERCHNK